MIEFPTQVTGLGYKLTYGHSQLNSVSKITDAPKAKLTAMPTSMSGELVAGRTDHETWTSKLKIALKTYAIQRSEHEDIAGAIFNFDCDLPRLNDHFYFINAPNLGCYMYTILAAMSFESVVCDLYTAMDNVASMPYMDGESICALCDKYGIGFADARTGVVNDDKKLAYVLVYKSGVDAHCGLMLRKKIVIDKVNPNPFQNGLTPSTSESETMKSDDQKQVRPSTKPVTAPAPKQNKKSQLPLRHQTKYSSEHLTALQIRERRKEEAEDLLISEYYREERDVKPNWMEERWTPIQSDMPLGQIKCMFSTKVAHFLRNTYKHVGKKDFDPEKYDIGLSILQGLDLRRRKSVAAHIRELWRLLDKSIHCLNHVPPKTILSEAKHVTGRLSNDFWEPKVVVIERVPKSVKNEDVAAKFKDIAPESLEERLRRQEEKGEFGRDCGDYEGVEDVGMNLDAPKINILQDAIVRENERLPNTFQVDAFGIRMVPTKGALAPEMVDKMSTVFPLLDLSHAKSQAKKVGKRSVSQHANARYSADVSQATLLFRLIKSLDKRVVLIDVGAKYARNATWINSIAVALGKERLVIYQPVRMETAAYDSIYNIENEERYRNSEHFDISALPIRTADFNSVWTEFQHMTGFVVCLAFDVLYYMPQLLHAPVEVIGNANQYHILGGVSELAFGEGLVEFMNNRLRVYMEGNGNTYEHEAFDFSSLTSICNRWTVGLTETLSIWKPAHVLELPSRLESINLAVNFDLAKKLIQFRSTMTKPSNTALHVIAKDAPKSHSTIANLDLISQHLIDRDLKSQSKPLVYDRPIDLASTLSWSQYIQWMPFLIKEQFYICDVCRGDSCCPATARRTLLKIAHDYPEEIGWLCLIGRYHKPMRKIISSYYGLKWRSLKHLIVSWFVDNRQTLIADTHRFTGDLHPDNSEKLLRIADNWTLCESKTFIRGGKLGEFLYARHELEPFLVDHPLEKAVVKLPKVYPRYNGSACIVDRFVKFSPEEREYFIRQEEATESFWKNVAEENQNMKRKRKEREIEAFGFEYIENGAAPAEIRAIAGADDPHSDRKQINEAVIENPSISQTPDHAVDVNEEFLRSLIEQQKENNASSWRNRLTRREVQVLEDYTEESETSEDEPVKRNTELRVVEHNASDLNEEEEFSDGDSNYTYEAVGCETTNESQQLRIGEEDVGGYTVKCGLNEINLVWSRAFTHFQNPQGVKYTDPTEIVQLFNISDESKDREYIEKDFPISGPELYTDVNGICKIVEPYVFDHKHPTTLICAITNRHLASTNAPSEEMLIDFARFVKDDVRVRKELFGFPDFEVQTPKDWCAEKKAWPENKKRRYEDYITMILNVGHFLGYGHPNFTAMVKSGEFNYATSHEVFSARARLIWDPEDRMMFVAWCQQFFISVAKHWYPEFIHALNSKKLAKKINDFFEDKVPENWTRTSWDGSAHDSNQHVELMRIVDDTFMDAVFPKFIEIFPISNRLAFEVLDILKDHTANLHITINKKYVGKFVLRGTTFSGHPTKTTLGNTLRVIYYGLYTAARAGIPYSDLLFFVSGDDACMWIRSKDVEAWTQSFWQVYDAPKTNRAHGLGQAAKSLNFGHWWDLEFISKRSILTNGKVVIVRDIKKAITGSRYYSGAEITYIKDPRTHAYAVAYTELHGCRSMPLTSLIYQARLDYGVRNEKVLSMREKKFINIAMVDNQINPMDEMIGYSIHTGTQPEILVSTLYNLAHVAEPGQPVYVPNGLLNCDIGNHVDLRIHAPTDLNLVAYGEVSNALFDCLIDSETAKNEES